MSASGGGDTPEAVADALHSVLSLPYRKTSTKMYVAVLGFYHYFNLGVSCVFVADAPPHGMGYTGDDYPNGSPNKHDPIAIAHEMATRGIVIYSVGCEPVLGSTAFARDVNILSCFAFSHEVVRCFNHS